MSASEPRPGRTASLVVNVLLGLAIVLALLAIVPAILGYKRYVVDGHSMETAIPYASVTWETEAPVSDLKVGDVITFKPPPEYNVTQLVTHRIISIDKQSSGKPVFRTKGDNNDSTDPWTIVLDASTQPRVDFHVPYVGYLYIALSNAWVRFLVIVIPALAAAVWIAVVLWRDAGREVEREKERIAGAPRGTT
jgi:signal peptidase I